MNWKQLLQVLAAGAIAGAAQTAAGHLTNQQPAGKADWKELGNASMFGAILGALTAASQTQSQAPSEQ